MGCNWPSCGSSAPSDVSLPRPVKSGGVSEAVVTSQGKPSGEVQNVVPLMPAFMPPRPLQTGERFRKSPLKGRRQAAGLGVVDQVHAVGIADGHAPRRHAGEKRAHQHGALGRRAGP